MNAIKTTLTLALTAAIGSAGLAYAQGNPFALDHLGAGTLVAAGDDKTESGKCGTGKCGVGKTKPKDAKCGGDAAKTAEGKCGAGMDAKTMEGKCGTGMTKPMEGKCGTGKK